MADDREAQLAEAEHHFGVRLPEDYRQFILQSHRTEELESATGSYLVLYPPTELADLDETGEYQQRFPGGLPIGGNGSREVLFYDFRQDPPPLVLLDITAEDSTAALFQASSLTELLDRFPQQGWNFGNEDQ